MEKKNGPDFIATLKYSTSENGGRKTAAHSGYRPMIKFPFSPMHTSGQQIFIGRDQVSPGESIDAEITLVSVPYFAGQLFEGLEFIFTEGSTIIGTGIIKTILNTQLL